MARKAGASWEWFAELFALLSEAYLEPEADVGRRAASLAEDADSASGHHGAALRSALAGMAECRESPVERGTEFVRLFLHGAGNATAHPYESVHRFGRLMAPECLSALSELYEEAQIHPRADLSVPPDHLGLELECLAYALANLGGAPAGSPEQRRWADLAFRMVSEHLEPFAANFSQKVEAAAPSPFYHWAGEALGLGLGACRARLARLLPDAPED